MVNTACGPSRSFKVRHSDDAQSAVEAETAVPRDDVCSEEGVSLFVGRGVLNHAARVITLAAAAAAPARVVQVLPYAEIQSTCELPDVAAVEQLVTESVYAGLIEVRPVAPCLPKATTGEP